MRHLTQVMRGLGDLPLARIQGSLRAKLLVSYLLIVAVGALTLVLVIVLSGPALMSHVVVQSANLPAGGALTERLREDLAAALVNAMLLAITGASAVAAVTAVLTAIVLSRYLTAPIHGLAGASRLLAAGHYGTRVTVTAEDELGQLAASFNTLAATLERAEERRLQLIGDVAHELRTPLATLQGNMEGLLDGVVAPSAELWAQLHSDVGRLRRLVDDLQVLSRVDAHQVPVHCTALDPCLTLNRAADRLRQQFDEAGIRLAVECPPALPWVFADADRVMQILVNLLGNALRYTPTGGTVALSARAQPHQRDVTFAVADTGIGIDPEHLPHLFERFYRVNQSRTRTVGGSGIGLTIARALVEVQRGTMRVESAGRGRGTTATFTLPQSRMFLTKP